MNKRKMMCSGEVIRNLTKEAVEKQNKVWECIFFEKKKKPHGLYYWYVFPQHTIGYVM